MFASAEPSIAVARLPEPIGTLRRNRAFPPVVTRGAKLMPNSFRLIVVVSAMLLPLEACADSAPSGSTVAPGSFKNPAYEAALNHWVDHSEEDLVSAWGVPNRSQRLTDGGQAFEYHRMDAQGHMLCSTLFTSDIYGKIRTWTYRGADCRAPQLGDYGGSS
jgi:hypothetical protein